MSLHATARHEQSRANQQAVFTACEDDGGKDDFIAIPANFRLESGASLPDAHLRLRRFGPANAPIVIVAGGISAGRFVCGPHGWWSDIVGPGAPIDAHLRQVIGFDFSPVGDARVAINPVDQARLLLTGLDVLGACQINAFVGASYGGMVGLALTALAPSRVERLCVISAAHRPAPLAQGWRGVQRRIVEYALSHHEAARGLALARQLAMISYRSADEFESRFARVLDCHGRSDLDQYLIARGAAYAEDMAPLRWLSLSEAIDRCAVAPQSVQTPTTLIACPTDQIVPISEMRACATLLPRLAAFHELPSLYGHDAFLKEPARLGAILTAFLED